NARVSPAAGDKAPAVRPARRLSTGASRGRYTRRLGPRKASPMAIHDSILDTIGRTPVVRLQRLAPPGVELHAKVEAFNPGGSVKDRLALAIILDAEARGVLKPGDTVVER